MATELGVAYISLLPEMKSFRPAAEKGMDRVGKGVATRFGVGFNGAIGSIVSRSAGIFAAGFAGVKIGGFLKDAISQASDLGETTSKVTQIFGPAAKDILKFSKTSATALGQTQQAALDANATFGIFGKAAGLQGKELSGFTTNLTTLASDLASFNNTSPEQAIEAIGSALRGETEPMRAYGVLLDDASLRQEALAQGLIKTTKQALTPQQKVLAAQALIMKQTTTAQGDFARTSGGLANQQRILSARFSDFKTTIGAIALPLATKFFGFLNNTALPAVTGLFNLLVKGDFSTAFRKAFNVEEDSKFVGFLLGLRTTVGTVFKEIKGGVVAFAAAWKYNDGQITSSGFPGFMERVGFAARQTFDFFKAEVLPRLVEFGGFIKKTIIPALSGMAGFVLKNKDFFVPFAGAILAVVAGLKAWAIIQGVLNVVLAANPISLVIIAIAALVAGLVYAYKNSETFRKIVDAAFKVVAAAGKFMWNTILKPLFGFMVATFKLVSERAQFWARILVAAFNALKGPAVAVFRFIVGQMLDFIGNMLSAAAKAFGWVPGIGPKLKTAASEFQKFKTSVNSALNGITDQSVKIDIKYSSSGVNLTTPSSVGRRATGGPGGPVRGPGSTTSDRAGLYALSNREWVIRAKATQKYGDHAMAMVNAGRATIIPDGGFASGGRPGLKLDTGFPSSSFPASATTVTAKAYAAKFAEAFAKQMGVNPRLAGALNFARGQAGKPYVWGGVGPGGYDCSGFLSAIVNVAQGRSPYQRRFATGSMPAGLFAPGPGALSVGWFRGNPGHTAGTLNGVNVESRGGRGVVVGSGARGATNGLFNSGVYHLKGYAKGGRAGDPPFDLLNPRGKQYLGDDLAREILPKALSFDNGGLLPTGYSIVHNGTGSPEPVGHDFLRSSDLDGMRMELDAPGVGVLTGFIRLTAQGEISRSNKELKRRLGRN